MKNFLAIFIGTASALEKSQWNTLDEAKRRERQSAGIKAWEEWIEQNHAAIIDHGTPLGKTKRASRAGIDDIRNNMTAYALVRAETHDAAARLFENHPHFTIFPGEAIEIMECLPIPGR